MHTETVDSTNPKTRLLATPRRNIAVVVVANAVAAVLDDLPAQLETVRADLIARYRP